MKHCGYRVSPLALLCEGGRIISSFKRRRLKWEGLNQSAREPGKWDVKRGEAHSLMRRRAESCSSKQVHLAKRSQPIALPACSAEECFPSFGQSWVSEDLHSLAYSISARSQVTWENKIIPSPNTISKNTVPLPSHKQMPPSRRTALRENKRDHKRNFLENVTASPRLDFMMRAGKKKKKSDYMYLQVAQRKRSSL